MRRILAILLAVATVLGLMLTFSAPALAVDITPPSVAMVSPPSGFALQDGVTFVASAIDSESGVNSVTFSIREDNGGSGRPFGFEDIPAIHDPATGNWTLWFDTLQLQDGYYVVLVKATDGAGIVGSITVPYSVRNWAVVSLLPAGNINAGSTVPVEFSVVVAAAVDPAQPFVYNEDLTIKIYAVVNPPPNTLLQTSVFGTGAQDYQIDVLNKKYFTNFQTLEVPKTYLVEIWRTGKNFLVGSFRFATTTGLTATIDFDRDGLYLGSKGKVVTVYIELPEGYDVGQIDISSIRLNGIVPALAKPTTIGDYDEDGVPDLMVKFSRAAVEGILPVGDQVEVTITGKVAGIDFEGSDTFRVIG